ncbi:hypothetical protein [Parasphingorhabdus sp.]|uniref:hypothetical protein n=1 Tax=Parasphingorhabdus sp. TaxID=2709688 RepID=UPI003A8D892E
MLRKVVIWAIAVVIGSLSALSAIGAISKNKAPDLAMAVVPLNGFAAETVSSNRVKLDIAQNNGNFANVVSDKALRQAKKAFEREPLTPEAVTVIALTTDSNRQRQLIEQAYNLSRREQLVTGWLIVNSAAENNIPSILRYYDSALRTSSSSEPIVLPILAKALENDDFVDPMADFLGNKPPWVESFWLQALATPEAIDNAAELRKATFNRGERNGTEARDSRIIQALIRQQQYVSAEELYDLFTDSKNRKLIIRNGNFASENDYPPIDWQLTMNGQFGASIADGKLKMSAIGGSGGVFARQIIKLPKKLLQLRVALDQAIPSNAHLSLDLACAEKNIAKSNPIKVRLLEKSVISKISNEKSECQYYWLSVVGRSDEGLDGFDLSLDSISLRPIV